MNANRLPIGSVRSRSSGYSMNRIFLEGRSKVDSIDLLE